MVIQELSAKLGLDIDELGFSRAQKLLEKMKLGYFAFGTAALGALALGATLLTKATADAGDAARKLAQSTGVSSIALQELIYAGSLADVSVDKLAQGMRFLAKSGVRDVRAEFLRLSTVFKKLPNDGAKVQFAIEKFGKAGAGLIPMLNDLDEATLKEAHLFGLVISEEDQKASEEFNDQITRLIAVFKGLRNQIGLALLRPMTALFVGFRKLIIDVKQGAAWVKTLTLAFKVFAFVLGGAVLTALFLNAGALATAVSWYVALGVAATVAAVKAAAAWLVAAAPAILLVAVFAAMLLILEDVYQFLNGGDSLIGLMLNKFLDFAQAWIKEPGRWWVIMRLKSAIDMAGQLVSVLSNIVDPSGTLKRMGDLAEQMGLERTVHNPTGTVADAQAAFSAFQGKMFGGGAAPSAAPGAKTRVQVNAPVTISIAPSAGASAGDIADAVATKIDEHHKSTLRSAAVGIQ